MTSGWTISHVPSGKAIQDYTCTPFKRAQEDMVKLNKSGLWAQLDVNAKGPLKEAYYLTYDVCQLHPHNGNFP